MTSRTRMVTILAVLAFAAFLLYSTMSSQRYECTVTVEFQAIFNDDPLLPPELVPRPWPGRTARELLLRSRRTAMRLRTSASRPALFRTYDDLIESIP